MFVLGLVAFLSGLLSLLSWIGWRFFIATAPVSETSPVPTIPARSAPRMSWYGRSGMPRFTVRQLGAVLAVLVVGGAVVGSVFLFSGWIVPDPLSAIEMDRQAHIQGALNPERLVPPPALPPSMFVGSERPALETADRDWSKLSPAFTQPVLRVLARLQERGFPFALLEGYRSPERQEMLADMGNQVTNARAFQSKHQFGLAVDLAPIREGRLVISERDPWAMEAYTALGEEAEKAGLVWGGVWSFKDYGHIEMAGARPASERSPQ